MRKKDFLWGLTLIFIVLFLVYPTTHNLFLSATKAHPYLMGFVKVSILATLGELLATRIASGEFKKNPGIIYRFLVWGFIGMVFVIMFDIFAGGVGFATEKGLLPHPANASLFRFTNAFFISAIMNLTFGPTFMAFHRITDTYIDLGQGNWSKIRAIKTSQVIKTIDWGGFINFVVLKTIPLFWIPAHTITFMLPSEYRVLAAAFLSIALGAILAFAKSKKSH